jgi:hypothetical protein
MLSCSQSENFAQDDYELLIFQSFISLLLPYNSRIKDDFYKFFSLKPFRYAYSFSYDDSNLLDPFD